MLASLLFNTTVRIMVAAMFGWATFPHALALFGTPCTSITYRSAATVMFVVQVSLLCGVILLIMAGAKLGCVMELLTKPITSSFLSAGIIIIAASQVSTSLS